MLCVVDGDTLEDIGCWVNASLAKRAGEYREGVRSRLIPLSPFGKGATLVERFYIIWGFFVNTFRVLQEPPVSVASLSPVMGPVQRDEPC